MKTSITTIQKLLVAVLMLAPLAGRAQEGKSAKPLANFDVRISAPAPQASNLRGLKSADITSKLTKQSAAISSSLAGLEASVPNLEVTRSPLTGGIELLGSPNFLTEAAPGRTGAQIVMDFYAANKALFGLSDADLAQLFIIGESFSPSGLRTVRVEQRINGIPVFQSETRVTMTSDGRIVRLVGLFVPNAIASVVEAANPISAQAALEVAMQSVSVEVDAAQMSLVNTSANGNKTDVVPNDPDVSGNVTSHRVYFLGAPGTLVPAWSQVAYTATGGAWYTIVDAGTSSLLWRKSIKAHASTEQARFSVYVQADGSTPADSPSPLSPTTVVPGSGTQPSEIARTTVNMLTVQSATASPNGWIADGGTTTNGNNVHAYMDAVSSGGNNNLPDTLPQFVIDGAGKPIGNPDAFVRNRDFLGASPRDFSGGFNPPPVAGDPEAGQTATGNGSNGSNAFDSFRRGSVTQSFYTTNWYHDQLHALGFDQAAGNFQTDNFGGGGLGNDAVLAETQDNSGTNNANFSTPPDGSPGRMQMFRFTGPTVDRDSNMDSEIVIHELTHGLSNRLIGNGSGLNWAIGGAMGEGWSDFYALSLLNRAPSDDPNARYAAGAYATYKLGGLLDNYLYAIRRFPYCTDNAVNPLTWADVDQTTNSMAGGIAQSPLNFNGNGAMEVHNAGEVWCMTLWEVRSRIIADPAGANGNVATGNLTTLEITTDAMKLTPINPSFTEARDAILLADFAASAGTNEQSIWAGFADRGLGYNSLAPNKYQFGYTASHMGVKESFDLPYLDVQSVAINDAIGNNNGALDPNEPSQLVVQLKNPWRKASQGVASATAVLTSSTPGVVINNGNSTYGAIAALGSASGTPFQITVPAGATAGQSLSFTITVTSTLGVKAVDFKLRVGTAGGAGAPITLTRTIVGGLAIPDAAPGGVTDTFNVAQDLDIMDLDFRVDSLTHTFTGDLTVMLKGPTGYGAELIAVIGGTSDGGSGDNMTNMVMDDQSPNGGLLGIAAASAPYTGTWQPMFNQAEWVSVGFGAPDPTGQLSRFNSSSSLGDWKVVVSDQFATDTGTLNSWSLIITPRTYTVTAFVPQEIAVFDGIPPPAPANERTDNVGTFGFGSVNTGSSSAAQTFTIQNLGSATADLTGLVVTSTNATEFTFTAPLVTTLAPGITTTFTVTFSPSAAGARSGVINIASNDADENPFRINVGGTGAVLAPVVTTFNYTGAVQTYTVPAGVTSIYVVANGAQGGNSTASGVRPGNGATMTGDFAVTPGEVLTILVGQQPSATGGNGGGGGTFVVRAPSIPLIVAGGGGGSAAGVDSPNKHGQTGTAGGNAIGGGGAGGTGGNGGSAGLSFSSGAGGGFLTNGANGWTANSGGSAFVNGGAGGSAGAIGGFGGGGSGSSYIVGGGGGGYSGGGGGSNSSGSGSVGGGGGSYNAGTNQVNTSGANSGHGLVQITSGGGSSSPEIAVFTGNSTAPVDERTDNTGIYGFGSVNTGSSSAAQTFTIQNLGSATADLTGLAVTSTNATEFTFTAPLATTLAPGATTTFTVTFSPSATGALSGVINIASNDADENPFEINVGGTGTVPAPVTDTFSFTGGVQTFVVPPGVTSVTLETFGAQGRNNAAGVVGGLGGSSTGKLAVTPGETLYIHVGGGGTIGTTGGFNGGGNAGTSPSTGSLGGGGGGGSDVRAGGTGLNNRVIVAGGGGGAGGNRVATLGRGTGGGGGGGYYGGGGGAAWPGATAATLPTGGTQIAGGTGGDSVYTAITGNDGLPGTLGTGGAGGAEVDSNQSGSETGMSGGVGGGLTGGGGSHPGVGNFTGQSGAGGASYLGGVTEGVTLSGTQSGNGLVKITYGGSAPGLVFTGLPITTQGTDYIAGGNEVPTREMNFVPVPGQSYPYIEVTGAANDIIGTFNDLPDGGVVAMNFNGVIHYFQVNYNGGVDGNDLIFTSLLNPGPAEWKWTAGPDARNAVAIFGTEDVASADNNPGARQGAMNWRAPNGNLWMFGGYGYASALTNPPRYLNDLWEYDRVIGQWIWHSGAQIHNQFGTYGSITVAAAANTPGARHTGTSWTDDSGNLWVFGGFGLGASGTIGRLNDLWRFSISTGQWTWMKGSDTIGAAGVYSGAAATLTPGARQGATGWATTGGNLYLFGGTSDGGTTFHNDLWLYTTGTGNWTVVKGNSTTNLNGTYGVQGTPAAANTPGARRDATGWVAKDGGLWLFGGQGLAATGATVGDMSDLWSFNTTTSNWTHVSGPTTQGGAGTYTALGSPGTPAARSAGSGWVTVDGDFWLVGGFKNSRSSYNDVWIYDIGTSTWTWQLGSSTLNAAGVYGTKDVAAPGNQPGARFTPSTWVTLNGAIWVFGGGGFDSAGNGGRLSDLWRYGIATPAGAPPEPSPEPFPNELIVNAAPNTNDAAAGTMAYVPVVGQLTGTDADGDHILFLSSSPTTLSQGTLTLNPDGTWSYSPAPGFVGQSTFQFRAADAYGGSSAVRTLVITVVTNPADGDNDGLPDTYEQSLLGGTGADALGDADLDGQSNYFEYLAGTSPVDAAQSLSTAPSIAAGESDKGGSFKLDLNHVRPGVSYHLETSSDLDVWQRIGTFTFSVSGSATLEDPTPPTGQPQFYRVSLETSTLLP